MAGIFKGFLKHLSKNNEDWQVKQADYTLRLYHFFLSQGHQKNQENLADRPNEWKELEDKTRKALHLMHRSLSTEKTYLSWLRRFRDLVKKKAPEKLDGKYLQDFLICTIANRNNLQIFTTDQSYFSS